MGNTFNLPDVQMKNIAVDIIDITANDEMKIQCQSKSTKYKQKDDQQAAPTP